MCFDIINLWDLKKCQFNLVVLPINWLNKTVKVFNLVLIKQFTDGLNCFTAESLVHETSASTQHNQLESTWNCHDLIIISYAII